GTPPISSCRPRGLPSRVTVDASGRAYTPTCSGIVRCLFFPLVSGPCNSTTHPTATPTDTHRRRNDYHRPTLRSSNRSPCKIAPPTHTSSPFYVGPHTWTSRILGRV